MPVLETDEYIVVHPVKLARPVWKTDHVGFGRLYVNSFNWLTLLLILFILL
jgi:hypothetical protein